MSSYNGSVAKLEEAYYSILKKTDFSRIYSTKNLSGTFLACPDESYFESKRKVLFIGQEPKTWRINCPIRHGSNVSREIIKQSMSDSLIQSKMPPGKHKLLRFYNKCSSELSGGGKESSCSAVYSNQFCMSYNRKSPEKSTAFSMIANLSNQLLKAQFDILKPDVAIFTTGSSRDSHLKSAFIYSDSKVIEPRRLWYFKVNETHCFRINHPSARQALQLDLERYQNKAILEAKLCVPIFQKEK
ncbi:hypothetical protein [Vibrio rotiferianus]|uniref:hypothetical protein n=1 Tax=Vibrio rotiferianus TaxID=190895 RepID=UPI000B5A062B|nr:hypothetical protein [Vibrio rotiferianus]ASI93576.1 hypothetical protein BSZ04_00690 [Vibrio rotiferianus]